MEQKETKPKDEKEILEDAMRKLCEEQMRLHPELYKKDGEQ